LSIEIIILIVLGGFVREFIEASMGMMYGTILSPVLIIAGFEPVLMEVPYLCNWTKSMKVK